MSVVETVWGDRWLCDYRMLASAGGLAKIYVRGAYTSQMMDDAGRTNTSASEMWRLFIAVPLSAAMRELMGELETRLKRHDWSVKWVDPDLAHITLKFLGNTDSERVPEIQRTLETVLPHHAGADVVTGPIGAFPSVSRPRVIWLGLDGDISPIAELAQGLDAAVSTLGFEREDRPFRPHITLGRLRRGKTSPRDFEQAVQALNVPPRAVALDRVQLVHSVLDRRGPTYTTLSEWPLRSSSQMGIADTIELVEHG